jgi:hypothetical protein
LRGRLQQYDCRVRWVCLGLGCERTGSSCVGSPLSPCLSPPPPPPHTELVLWLHVHTFTTMAGNSTRWSHPARGQGCRHPGAQQERQVRGAGVRPLLCSRTCTNALCASSTSPCTQPHLHGMGMQGLRTCLCKGTAPPRSPPSAPGSSSQAAPRLPLESPISERRSAGHRGHTARENHMPGIPRACLGCAPAP